MRTAIEISLYPLDADYIPPIKAFIERLNTYPELSVITNAMSTQISGEHARVFEILAKETETHVCGSGTQGVRDESAGRSMRRRREDV